MPVSTLHYYAQEKHGSQKRSFQLTKFICNYKSAQPLRDGKGLLCTPQSKSLSGVAQNSLVSFKNGKKKQ